MRIGLAHTPWMRIGLAHALHARRDQTALVRLLKINPRLPVLPSRYRQNTPVSSHRSAALRCAAVRCAGFQAPAFGLRGRPHGPAKISPRMPAIVSPAAEAQIQSRLHATYCPRLNVIELKEMLHTTTPPVRRDKRAPPAIPRIHLARDLRRNIAAAFGETGRPL
jgi:hypothetical protein